MVVYGQQSRGVVAQSSPRLQPRVVFILAPCELDVLDPCVRDDQDDLVVVVVSQQTRIVVLGCKDKAGMDLLGNGRRLLEPAAISRETRAQLVSRTFANVGAAADPAFSYVENARDALFMFAQDSKGLAAVADRAQDSFATEELLQRPDNRRDIIGGHLSHSLWHETRIDVCTYLVGHGWQAAEPELDKRCGRVCDGDAPQTRKRPRENMARVDFF